MTPATIEAVDTIEVTQDTEITETETPAPLDPTSGPMTEQEAIGVAVEGLRELIKLNYHFSNRIEVMIGDRLPPAIKREQAARLRYEAAIKTLEGLTWWEGGE